MRAPAIARARNTTNRKRRSALAAVVTVGVTLCTLTLAMPAAYAATEVGLGTADSYVVLGGQSVTNTGPSVLNADLGVYPGTSITGFPPGIVVGRNPRGHSGGKNPGCIADGQARLAHRGAKT